MSEHWHGTPGGYTNRRCRCDACRAAWAAAHRLYMQSRPEQQRKQAARSKAWNQAQIAKGLTAAGKPRKRSQLSDNPRAVAARENQRRRRAARYAAGLTARGEPRNPQSGRVFRLPTYTDGLQSRYDQNNGAGASLRTNTPAPDGPVEEARYA